MARLICALNYYLLTYSLTYLLIRPMMLPLSQTAATKRLPNLALEISLTQLLVVGLSVGCCRLCSCFYKLFRRGRVGLVTGML